MLYTRIKKAQYALLRDYAETLLKTNPGSTVKIGVTPLPDGQVMFDKIYICLSGCKNGFKAGCRPLIGLDGAFLKTQIGGQILSAVAQDANHHIYVVAWAIVNIENKENWKWFLELLHDDLGDYKANGWCFISDMQKLDSLYYNCNLLISLVMWFADLVRLGLISAVEEVMPQVHYRFCVWHLWRNFNKQWKDLELRRLLWDAARSTTFQDFIGNMDKIKRVSEEAWTYLNKWPRHSWMKSQFSHRPKLDNICNNACEVFNARIKEARSKPIITLLEEVRMFVMRSIAKNKIKLNNHVGKLPPVIQSRLEKVRKESKMWVPIWTGDEAYEKFEIHGQPTNMVVDLGKRLCTCQFWMLTGISCVHACAALARVNKRPEDFCHPLVTMDSYRKTYEHYINPLPGQSMWEKSAYSQPQAPNIKRKPGKLTTKRRKDADEGTSLNKKAKQTVTLKRQPKPFTCTYCCVKGHTKRGCKQKRADELAAALATAAAAVAASKAKATHTGSTPATESSNTTNPAPPAADISPPVSASQAEEVELSQPSYGGTQDEV
ncbi:uncharacterized protein [Arachis hypogaea]|uniref:uncharacterized protein n=1 Tax=Arachis hypogaea TaxID=3818 RepID=UPI000DECFCC6|nr:uncharacterized protein LOC112794845 [Arachis hypogaea]